MATDTAVIEREDADLQVEESPGDDLRGAIQQAFEEARERQRDEGGRFVAERAEKPGKEVARSEEPSERTEPTEQVEKPTEQRQTLRVPQKPVVQQPATAPQPPATWSPAAKAEFAKLSPVLKAEIAKRETDVQRGLSQQDEHRQFGKTLGAVIQPYLPMIKAEGSDPVKAVTALLNTAYALRAGTSEQKESLLIGMMQTYSIDPNRIFAKLSGQQQPSQQVSPEIAALRKEIDELKQRDTRQASLTEQAENAQVQQTLEQFAADPKNVYFENVRPEMAALLGQGLATDIADAYEKACWARPDIRPLLLQQREQERQDATRQRARQARAAGSTLTGSPSGSAGANLVPPDPHASVEDDIRAAIREVNSRGE